MDTQTPLTGELPDTLASKAELIRMWQKAGWAGASTLPWPTPSPSLKIETQSGVLDWAKVSELAKGYVGLQSLPPNARVVSICTTLQDPKPSLCSEKSSSATFQPALTLSSSLPPPPLLEAAAVPAGSSKPQGGRDSVG